MDLFTNLRRELNVTIVVATHDPDVAARADRLLHVVDGRLSYGSPEATPVSANHRPRRVAAAEGRHA